MKDHKYRRLLRLVVILPVLSTSLLAQQSAAASCTMTALSLNLHGTRDPEAILAALREVSLERADLMLFQEVVRPHPGESGAVDQVAQELGMHVAYAPGFALRDGEEEGLAVLSRYPIVESRVIPLLHNDLLWKSRKRVALAVTVHAPAGELRVYNVHLDTRVNLKTRLEQLRPVAEEASSGTGPVLVGGDLNTNPYRWVAHTLPFLVAPDQGAGVLRYMHELGYASAFPRKTPTSRWFRMQLDWIFTKNLESGRVAVQPVSFSDHHALCACLSLPSASQITELRN